MTTEKELNSNNSGISDKRQKSNVSKIIWITGIILLLLLLVNALLLYINPGSHIDRIDRQEAQYNSISVALELFNSEFDTLPPSNGLDPTGKPYCGAMKFAEAMVGKDLKGFHPDSLFRSDGNDGSRKVLYPDANNLTTELYQANIKIRKGPYLPIENANAYHLNDIFENTGPFDGNSYVLCDEYGRFTHLNTGRRIGMPILYYKADISKNAHDINDPNNPDNIYNYKDNHAMLALGIPSKPNKKHPLFEDPTIFYKMTKKYKSTKQNVSMRADSYILLSAGKDGLYGTKDDIVNFDMGWKPK